MCDDDPDLAATRRADCRAWPVPAWQRPALALACSDTQGPTLRRRSIPGHSWSRARCHPLGRPLTACGARTPRSSRPWSTSRCRPGPSPTVSPPPSVTPHRQQRHRRGGERRLRSGGPAGGRGRHPRDHRPDAAAPARCRSFTVVGHQAPRRGPHQSAAPQAGCAAQLHRGDRLQRAARFERRWIPGSVQLWRGTTPVAGTVRFADAAHLRAEFHPDGLLAPQTDYQLVVTTAIRDLNGLALDSADHRAVHHRDHRARRRAWCSPR